MPGKSTLFWNLKVDNQAAIQAALMLYQYDTYGEKLEVPTPPMVSNAAWQCTQLETLEEIDRLMRRTKRHFKGVGIDH